MTERIRAVVTVDRAVPSLSPRVVGVVLSLSAILLVPWPYAGAAILLAVVGAVFPPTLGTWGCILVIGLSQLARPEDAADPRFYLALAVGHLLHVTGALALVVPPFGVMQARVLARPLLRWLVIQVPAQAVLAAVLLLHETRGLGSAAGSAAAIVAACVAGAVLLLVVLSPRT